MSRPWMPLYVADYLRDTRRLTAAEHGAYLLLIMEYWTVGKLPNDDKQLARIACMSASEWRKAKPNVEIYFQDGWSGHKRIDVELARSAEISSKRSASAKLKHSKSSANAHPNAEQVDAHARASSQPQSQEERKDAASRPSLEVVPADPAQAEKDFFRRFKEVCGENSGGLARKLLTAKSNNVALARAATEQASTKENPREFIGAIIRNRDGANDLRATGDAW